MQNSRRTTKKEETESRRERGLEKEEKGSGKAAAALHCTALHFTRYLVYTVRTQFTAVVVWSDLICSALPRHTDRSIAGSDVVEIIVIMTRSHSLRLSQLSTCLTKRDK